MATERAAIEELYDYTGWAWGRIARVVDQLAPEMFAREVAGSGWPTLAACFEHWVAAYDGWLNHPTWGLGLGEVRHPGSDALKSWPAMKAYRAQCRESFRAALAMPESALYAKREFRFGGKVELLSPADILTNLLIHERGHHGDLNTLFDGLGVRGYFIDYRFFVTRREEFILDDGTL